MKFFKVMDTMLLSEMLSKNALKRFDLKRTCLFIYFRIKNYLSTVAWDMYTWVQNGLNNNWPMYFNIHGGSFLITEVKQKFCSL